MSAAASIVLQIRLNEFIASGVDPSALELATQLADEIMQMARERCVREVD